MQNINIILETKRDTHVHLSCTDSNNDDNGDNGDTRRRRMRSRKRKGDKGRLSASFGAMRLRGRGSNAQSIGRELRELSMELADTLSLWMDEYNRVKKLAQEVYRKWNELKEEREKNRGLNRTTASLKVRRVLQAPPSSSSSDRRNGDTAQLGIYDQDSTVFSPYVLELSFDVAMFVSVTTSPLTAPNVHDIFRDTLEQVVDTLEQAIDQEGERIIKARLAGDSLYKRCTAMYDRIRELSKQTRKEQKTLRRAVETLLKTMRKNARRGRKKRGNSSEKKKYVFVLLSGAFLPAQDYIQGSLLYTPSFLARNATA